MLSSVVISFVLFLAATIVVAVVFLIWMVASAVRLVCQGMAWVVRGGRSPNEELRVCPRLRCGQPNPPDAKYCRRCGGTLATEQA